MPGYAHIFRLGARDGYGKTITEYQFTYSHGGNSWARTFDGEELLAEFLGSNIGLTRERTEQTIAELVRSGKITVAEVEIPEQIAPAIGLEQMPSEY